MKPKLISTGGPYYAARCIDLAPLGHPLHVRHEFSTARTVATIERMVYLVTRDTLTYRFIAREVFPSGESPREILALLQINGPVFSNYANCLQNSLLTFYISTNPSFAQD